MGEFLHENASGVFAILGGVVAGIFSFLTMWFRSKREVRYRLAEKLMDRRIAAHEEVRRFSMTMRDIGGTNQVDNQGEIIRLPRIFLSRVAFYEWFMSYHEMKLSWEMWFSTDVTREMYLLQTYLYNLHMDLDGASSEVYPDVGVIVREDFLDFSSRLEQLVREYFSRDLLRLRLDNPKARHTYRQREIDRRMSQTIYIRHRARIQRLTGKVDPLPPEPAEHPGTNTGTRSPH